MGAKKDVSGSEESPQRIGEQGMPLHAESRLDELCQFVASVLWQVAYQEEPDTLNLPQIEL